MFFGKIRVQGFEKFNVCRDEMKGKAMFEKIKGDILFHRLFKRRDIDNAYKMVGPEDSWYDTITTVHNSLAQIKKLPYEDWTITSHDGLLLNALYYPCESSTKTVIWCTATPATQSGNLLSRDFSTVA